ncbi:DNA replication and repair protein RecF [bacterium HR16]|nr:DNA replication and repair protein RecF [bacterium HR16]
MYRSFTVRNFRCFKELTLSDLARVNLIAGKNNVGKTALLEAMFLHCGAYNPELAIRINAFRGIENVQVEFFPSAETPWHSLFRGFDTTKTIELEGYDHRGTQRTLRIQTTVEPVEVKAGQHKTMQTIRDTASSSQFGHAIRFESVENGTQISRKMMLGRTGIVIDELPAPPFPAFLQGARVRIPLREQAHLFGKLEVQDKQQVVVEALKIIEPRLKRVSVVVLGDEPILHGDIGTGRLMPLPLMGEGMVRVANMVVQIGNASGGVVLIDEFENGIHHSVLKKVWTAVAQATREFDTQLFATTHSWECIVAAHEAFSELDTYDFRLHRLERVNEHIRVVTYDQKTLQAAIETGLEVR